MFEFFEVEVFKCSFSLYLIGECFESVDVFNVVLCELVLVCFLCWYLKGCMVIEL